MKFCPAKMAMSPFFIISSERSQTVYYYYPVGQVTKYNVYTYPESPLRRRHVWQVLILVSLV